MSDCLHLQVCQWCQVNCKVSSEKVRFEGEFDHQIWMSIEVSSETVGEMKRFLIGDNQQIVHQIVQQIVRWFHCSCWQTIDDKPATCDWKVPCLSIDNLWIKLNQLSWCHQLISSLNWKKFSGKFSYNPENEISRLKKVFDKNGDQDLWIMINNT